jgi:16S rRNA U516 pseudouridylate synthase RsuA-like enzyme
MTRLDRLVSSARGLRLRAAGELIRTGVFSVEGRQVVDPGWTVIDGLEKVTASDGGPLPNPFHRLLMIHKPKNYVCERRSKNKGKLKVQGGTQPGSVYDLLGTLGHPEIGVYGRLDLDTTGLLLAGTDGKDIH